MNSQITLSISLIMIALFSIAIIGFAIGFANDNNSYVNIADDPDMLSFDLAAKGNLTSFQEGADDTYQSIVETTLEPGSDVVSSSGSFSITKTSLFNTAYNVIKVGNDKIFGKGSSFAIFFDTLLLVIGFLFALYLIKTWRGSP